MTDSYSFGAWVRKRRRALDLTQDALALRVGCAVSMVRKIELDERRPSKQLAALLAAGLELPEGERAAFLKAARAELASDQLAEPAPINSPTTPAPPPGHASRLPTPPTPLIGRAPDLARLHAIAERPGARLLTLTGAGGSGKTRLALQLAAELADRYSDGAVFVDLAPLQSTEQMLTAIAQQLAVRELVGTTLQARLCEHLAPTQYLLLLDNFEHLLGAAPVVAELLRAAPRLTVLVTSRVALRLSGEHEYAVPPLEVPPADTGAAERSNVGTLERWPAVQLFVARAQAVQPVFTLSETNASSVAAICRKLDGLPLAVELAAARVKLFSPAALLARLDDRFRLLTGGARDLPARQQTLRAASDWSYNLLRPDEQQLFWRLGVFVGGWTLEAAEAVTTLEGGTFEHFHVLDGLQALVDHSLVRQEAGPDGAPRFRRLETIREYVVERLEASGEAEGLRRQHALHFTKLAEHGSGQGYGPESGAWYDRLAADYANLRAALEWSVAVSVHVAIALRLTAALSLFWLNRGPLDEGLRWIKRALALPWAVEQCGARAAVLNAAGRLELEVGSQDLAEQFLSESLELYEQLEDQRSCSEVLNHLGMVWWNRGDLERSASFQEASLRAAEAAGSRDRAGWALHSLGYARAFQGQTEVALVHVNAGLALFDELRDQMGRAASLCTKAYLQWKHGDIAGAISSLSESQQVAREEVGDTMGIILPLQLRAEIARDQGRDTEAQELFEQSLTLAQEFGHQGVVACAHYGLCLLALTRGDTAAAQAHLNESLTRLRSISNAWNAIGRLAAGAVALGSEQFLPSQQHYAEYLASYHEHQVTPRQREAALALALTGLATALALETAANSLQAARLWGASAEAYLSYRPIPFGSTYFSVPALDPALVQRAQATARAALGDPAFDAAWTAGQALTLDQAVEEVLATHGAQPRTVAP